MTDKSTADILLELLEYVDDGSQLETLLEPANLINLLKQHSHMSEEAIKSKLKNGSSPGELLLGLFQEGHKADALLASLPADSRPKASRKVVMSTPTPMTKPAPASKRDSEIVDVWAGNLFGEYTIYFVLALVSITAVLPALSLAGFTPMSIFSSLGTVTLISAIAGAIGGMLYMPNEKISWRGIIFGLLLNLGILYAIVFYAQSRQSIFKIELVIPIILGIIPAFGVNAVLSRLFKR